MLAHLTYFSTHQRPEIEYEYKVFQLISLFKWAKWLGISIFEKRKEYEDTEVKGEEVVLYVCPGDF